MAVKEGSSYEMVIRYSWGIKVSLLSWFQKLFNKRLIAVGYIETGFRKLKLVWK